MPQPLVSIITVARNSAGTIADTIRSVQEQNYPYIEHIIVDGASTDGTLEVIETFRPGISELISEPDRGIYDAMNKGIQRSTGQIVGLLNSDDVYADKNAVSIMVEALQTNLCDAAFADLVYVRHSNMDKTIRRFDSAVFDPTLLANGIAPAHPTLFVRRKIFDQFGFYKTDYHISADFEFMARLFHSTEIKYVHVPKVIIKMRLGGVSTRNLRSLLRSNSEMLRACRENNISSNIFQIALKYPRKIAGYLKPG